MYKVLFFIVLFVSPFYSIAQFGDPLEPPLSLTNTIPIEKDSFIFIKNTSLANPLVRPYFVMAKSSNTSLTFKDFKLSKIFSQGEKLYDLVIYSDSCEGMMIKFSNLVMHPQSRLWVYNLESKEYVGSYSQEDVNANNELITSPLIGQKNVIEYLEPSGYQTPDFGVYTIYNFFDSTLRPESNSLFCMTDAICNSEVKYEMARHATCKILMIKDNHIGSCTGTLINNTNENGIPYILTANHCADRLSLDQFNTWEFHFNYEEPECSAKSNQKPLILKGADFVARSSDEYTMGKSDFLLIKLSKNIPITMNPVMIGWDRSENISSEGASFHHPKGDLKKVSKFKTKPESAFLDSITNLSTHYKLNWGDTERGLSVTLDGSSGCSLVDDKGLLKGTLTGGFSDCLHKEGFDYYGMLFYHWDKNSDLDMYSLKRWLDPKGSNAMTVPSRYYKDIIIDAIDNSITTSSNIEHSLNITINNKILSVNCSFANFTLNIYDLVGKKVMTKKVMGYDTSLELSELSSSMYIVETEVNNEKRRQKIIL